jgi:hypothetical protein
MHDLTEGAEPRCNVSNTETEEANLKKPYIDMELPNLVQDLTDKLDPSHISSFTLSVDPILTL